MIFLVDEENSIRQNPTFFNNKTLKKLGTEENFLNVRNYIYETTTANNINHTYW